MLIKKTILVVEDNNQHFAEIKNILINNNFEVFPLSSTKENFYSNDDFIKVIRTIYDTEIMDEVVNEEKRKLVELLSKIEFDGFIVDYELELKRTNCSGTNFYKNFIETDNKFKIKPILFLSGKRGNPINNVHTLINKINRENSIPIAFFMSKDKINNLKFLSDLENKINEIFIDKPKMPKDE